jgi:phosphoenolpyruvate carboxykinase (ATP)
MPIKATRALLNAALDGSLNSAEFRKDPYFGFEVPVAVRRRQRHPRPALDLGRQGRVRPHRGQLVDLFCDNFEQFADHVEEGVRQCAPKVAAEAA